MSRLSPQKQEGFTLLELMVVVVIVAILAAVAWPSYQNHVRKARRVECEGVLMRSAATLERRKSATLSYATNPAGGGQFPGGVSRIYCPAETGASAAGKRTYAVTFLGAPSSTTFTLQATPIGAQAADKCGTLTLNHLGDRGASGASAPECW
ncbi:MAG: prepilin-type N-terminal cleavage/methylation domain-containing protein [Zoogloeaceae bacterium]|jgi:type IV pilus assembly protein PilE|nr:prepilin-type N-terminal cleavage/methylation domain-containing protein [Zoogloeaceae bacterium]